MLSVNPFFRNFSFTKSISDTVSIVLSSLYSTAVAAALGPAMEGRLQFLIMVTFYGPNLALDILRFMLDILVVKYN